MYISTIFDKNYIPRASVMIASLEKHTINNLSKIFIFALDQEVSNYFSNRKNIEIININDLEDEFPELLNAKNNRKYVEYIFTLSPFMPLYIFNKFKYINRITTLDADLYFFDNPKKILDNLNNNIIGITKHDFDLQQQFMEVYGKYNVSFQSFPRTDEGISCLKMWANDCLDYCGDYLDKNERFADQKYLDKWITMYNNIIVFDTPSIGLAPWNVKKFNIEFRDNCIFNLKNIPIFYHYHHLRFKSKYHMIFADFGISTISKDIVNLYFMYWDELNKYQTLKFDNIKRNISKGSKFNLFSFLLDLKNYPHLFRFGSLKFIIDLRLFFTFFK